MLAEIQADFDRLQRLINAANELPDEATGEAESMVYEYLCVAIAGRLEQNIKSILVTYSDRKSNRMLNKAVSRLCQAFQNPTKEKILDLVKLFDPEFSSTLDSEWKEQLSAGGIVNDMIGHRKRIAHQTTNSRSMTKTKVVSYFGAYKEVVVRLEGHFCDS